MEKDDALLYYKRYFGAKEFEMKDNRILATWIIPDTDEEGNETEYIITRDVTEDIEKVMKEELL